jgi:hypothetical protein
LQVGGEYAIRRQVWDVWLAPTDGIAIDDIRAAAGDERL